MLDLVASDAALSLENDPTTFPPWPSKTSPGRTALRLDIARWALHQTFVSGCA